MTNRIYACIPTYQYIPARSFESILKACLRLKSEYKKFGTSLCLNTYLPEARNIIANNILKYAKDDDLTLWFDADMVFEFDQVKQLLKSFESNDYDILSGLYFTKNENKKGTPHIYYLSKDKKKFITGIPSDLPERGIINVDGVGFGFIVMRAEVLRRIKEEHGRCFDSEYYKENFAGEDLLFCSQAKKLGYKIGVDLSIKLGHYGGIVTD